MINLNRKCWLLALGLAIAALPQEAVHAQTVLDPSWRVTANTNKPGFLFNYFQNNDPNNTGNSTARAENDVAGLATDSTGALLPNLGDPTTIGGVNQVAIAPAVAANPTNGLLYFEISNVINLSKVDQSSKGNFIPDDQMPGVNLAGSTDGQAAEILTYLALPVGTNYLGVNSDDGFQAQAGANPKDAFGRVVLGGYEGGRGASDTIFQVVVQQAGVYPIRVVWENGGGDSNIEFFNVLDGATDATNKVLINDLANGGIPAYRAAAAPTPPYVKVLSPSSAPRQTDGTYGTVSAVLADGTTAVDDNSVTLAIDGKATPITKLRQGSFLTITTGTSTNLQLASEAHTGVLSYKDTTGNYSRTQQWTFYNLENLIFPATPVAGENFDSYPEATSPATAAPPGWILTNYTWLETAASGFGANGGVVWDLTQQHNDPFLNWCMIATNTASAMEAEILLNNTAQTINGIPVTGDHWMSSNCLFAASDSRARSVPDPNDPTIAHFCPQIQFAISAPFDLSTVANPVLSWSSGLRISGNTEGDALEYSVDNGSNWQAAFIAQNTATLFLNPDGSYDAVKMLTNMWPQLAHFPVVQDPTTRDFISVGPLGGAFGDVLLTPITPALSPFIVNRNDTATSRKVEAIRLPLAAHKSAVRLRFSHYGSCGWEWAVDNIAFYDIAPANVQTPAPHIDSINAAAGSITVKWSNGGTLYSAPSLSGSTWTTTGNSSGTFTETVSPGAKFYRVIR